MANELNLPLDPSRTGLTVTAILILNNAQVGSAISCPESGTLPGHYSGDMPAVAAGVYGVRFLSAGQQVGTGEIDWTGTVERTALLAVQGGIDSRGFLLQSADTGSTTVLRKGADAVTGTSIAEQIDALPEAAGRTIYNDLTYDGDGVAITQGSITSGTPADTLTLGTPLIFTSGGTGIDVNFEFELGSSSASLLTVYGYYTGTTGTTASRAMEVYLWDWTNSVWFAVSDGSNRVPLDTVNVVRQYAIAPQLQDPLTGLVRVRYASIRTNSGDTFVLDQHFVGAVVTGFTLNEIASAVVNYQIDPNVIRDGTHSRLGWFAWQIRPTVGGISSITGNEITTTGTTDRFFAIDGLYVGHTIQFHEGGTSNYRWAKIIAQTGAVLTVDAMPPDVTAPSPWHFYILPERTTTPDKVWANPTRTLTSTALSAADVWDYAGRTLDGTQATQLANLDAAISSRSTYDGSDTPGTVTLVSRLTSSRAGYLDKLNVTGTLAHSDDAATYRADVSGLLTAAAYTPAPTTAEIWGYTGRSLDGAQAATLVTIEGAALAVADGRFAIDYLNSTATQYNDDGTTRTVFDLYDADGNLATTPESAVDRRPI